MAEKIEYLNNFQVLVSDSYNVEKGDYDGAHTFQSRGGVVVGGMDTKVNKVLKYFYKTYKKNPAILSINVKIDDSYLINKSRIVVEWEVLIGESTDGKAYVGLTSRGGAGSLSYVGVDSTHKNSPDKQYDRKIKKLPDELNDDRFESKRVFDFQWSSSKSKGMNIRQIFGHYTNPNNYPPFSQTTPQVATVTLIDANTNQPIQGAQIQPPIPQISNKDLAVAYRTWANSTDELSKKWGKKSKYDLDATSTNPNNSYFIKSYNGGGKIEYESYLNSQEPREILSLTPLPITKISVPPLDPEIPPQLIISAPGYETKEIIPYKGDGTIKEQLGIIPLLEISKDFGFTQILSSQLTPDQISFLNNFDQTPEFLFKKQITSALQNLNTKLIPLIINQLAKFGIPSFIISKITSMLSKNSDKSLKQMIDEYKEKNKGKTDEQKKINKEKIDEQKEKYKEKIDEQKEKYKEKLDEQKEKIKEQKEKYKVKIKSFKSSSPEDQVAQIITVIDSIKSKIDFSIPKKDLDRTIEVKNQLVLSLNTIEKQLTKFNKYINYSTQFVTGLKNAYTIIENQTAIPSSTGAPNVPGISVKFILWFQDNKEKIKKKIDALELFNKSIASDFKLINKALFNLMQYIYLLDMFLQSFLSNSPPSNLSNNSEQLLNNLLVLTQQQSQQLSPVITNVNGFEMGIENEPTTNSLKRRRATARNKQGVVMLKGEWSFSSIDQILIDELVFYIQQNDLKAE